MRRGLAVAVLSVGICLFLPGGRAVHAASDRRAVSESPKGTVALADPKPSDDPTPSESPSPSVVPSPSPSPSPSGSPPPTPTPTRSRTPSRSSSPPPSSLPSPVSRGSDGPPALPADASVGFAFSPVASASGSGGRTHPSTVETTPASGLFTSPAAASAAAAPLVDPLADPPTSNGSTGWVRVPLVIGIVLVSAVLLGFGIKYDSTGRWPWQ